MSLLCLRINVCLWGSRRPVGGEGMITDDQTVKRACLFPFTLHFNPSAKGLILCSWWMSFSVGLSCLLPSACWDAFPHPFRESVLTEISQSTAEGGGWMFFIQLSLGWWWWQSIYGWKLQNIDIYSPGRRFCPKWRTYEVRYKARQIEETLCSGRLSFGLEFRIMERHGVVFAVWRGAAALWTIFRGFTVQPCQKAVTVVQ